MQLQFIGLERKLRAYMVPFVRYTLSSVCVAEWPPFGKQLPARLAVCSHCILSICNIYLFPVLVLRAGFAF